MATTVEARVRAQASPSTAPAPWYRDRNRLAVGAALAVVVVALIAWFVYSSGRRKEEFAQRSLNQARSAAESGNLPLASSELQKLIQTYGGTDAATEAVITLNQVRMVNGQSELAVVGLRDFLATKPEAQYRGRRTGCWAPRWRTAGNSPRPATPSSGPPRASRWTTSRRATWSMRAERMRRPGRRPSPSRRIGR